MKLSLKNMLISFALSLVLFSVVMTAVCVSIYRSRIDVRTGEGDGDVSVMLPSRENLYSFSETLLYYAENGDSGIRYAVFVGISDDDKTVILTPIADTLPVNFKNKVYYVSSITASGGEIEELVEALIGIKPTESIDVKRFDLEIASTVDGFFAQIKEMVQNDYRGYSAKRIDIVSDENGVANIEKTTAQFFTTKTK